MAGTKTSGKVKIAVILLAAAAVAAGVYSKRENLFAAKSEVKAPPAAAIVKTEKAAADKTISDKIVQNMSVEAEKRVKVLPRVTGRLLSLSVKTGDRVRSGQQVGVLEHDQQDALILSAAAQAASARAESEKAKAQMQNAKTNVERYRRLEKEGFSTQQQLDAMETEYVSMTAAYSAARAKERQYAAESARVASAKDDYIIRAPMDGVVLDDYSLTAGAMISPSSPVLDIADPSRLKATLKIPEAKIFAVKIGMPVRLRFDALPGEVFEGSVSRIDQYVDPATRTSSVEIFLDNEKHAGGRLRPGMFGEAEIIEREYVNAVTVPEGALHSGDNSSYIFIVKDGHAEMRTVKTGVKDGPRVQITEGLAPGEEVIIFGGNNLTGGEEVSVMN